MDLTILEKLGLILKYFTSSFMGIEIFLIVLLLFIFLILNMKKNNILIKILIPIFLLSILLFISGGFHTYVVESIDSFIKLIMNYYYFPSIYIYYIIILFTTFVFSYSIISDNLSKIKKILNYIFFSVIYLLFLGLTSLIIKDKIELVLDNSIYSNNLVLSFVQLSNIFLFIWIMFTIFYYFSKYLKRKYDK